MPKKSTVEIEGLIEKAVYLHEVAHLTNKQIAERFQSEGYVISTSSVQRALRARKMSEKEFQKSSKRRKFLSKRPKIRPGSRWQKQAQTLQWSCS